MGGVSKSKRVVPKDRPIIPPTTPRVRRGKASSRKAKGVILRRSQTRTCELSVDRSYSETSKIGQKNLEHARLGSVALKRNRSTARSRILTRQSRHTSLKGRRHPTDKSSANIQCIPNDARAKITLSKRSTSRPAARSVSRRPTSPSTKFVHHKSVKPASINQSPCLLKSHAKKACCLKAPVTEKQSVVRLGNDRDQAKIVGMDKRVPTTSPDNHGAAASVKLIEDDVKVSPTRLATVTRQERNRRHLAETSKSVGAETKDPSRRSYALGSRSPVRDVSLAFSVLAKPPCLMQSTVRPMIPDSTASSGTQHRNKGHDEWDNLEVWGLGRTSWRESVLATSKRNSQPDFDARPCQRLKPDPVPQRSARIKFSMYNSKPANGMVPLRKNTRTERRGSTRSTGTSSTQLLSHLPATTNNRKRDKSTIIRYNPQSSP